MTEIRRDDLGEANATIVCGVVCAVSRRTTKSRRRANAYSVLRVAKKSAAKSPRQTYPDKAAALAKRQYNDKTKTLPIFLPQSKHSVPDSRPIQGTIRSNRSDPPHDACVDMQTSDIDTAICASSRPWQEPDGRKGRASRSCSGQKRPPSAGDYGAGMIDFLYDRSGGTPLSTTGDNSSTHLFVPLQDKDNTEPGFNVVRFAKLLTCIFHLFAHLRYVDLLMERERKRASGHLELYSEVVVKLLAAAVAGIVIVVPVHTFAQQTAAPLTRAQVRQELIDLESVGYQPGASNDATYPRDIQAAQQRLAEKKAAQASYGEGTSSVSQAGSPAVHAPEASSTAVEHSPR